MDYLAERRGHARGLLLGAIAALTVVLVLGIKFFMGDDQAYVSEQPSGAEQLFKGSGGGVPPPGLAPAARSESSSGGGLDMFSKTNAGYYGEEASTAAAAGAAPAGGAVKISTAPAAARQAGKAAARTQADKTVIPRLKPASFGGAAPTPVAPGGGNQEMPDISGMIKQAQQQAKQRAGGD